jgi:F-type H+-transporting ATPase subunit epsilon
MRVSRIDGLIAFVAADASGSFGLRPGHERFVTSLAPGLVTFRLADGGTRYIACAGGSLFCAEDCISIVTARFLVDKRLAELPRELARTVSSEHEGRRAERQSHAEIERMLMKRLQEWSEQSGGTA